MTMPTKEPEGHTTELAIRIAELSGLLGMIPANEDIQMREPLTQNQMMLSDWLSTMRGSFLKLSLLIGKELDIQLQ